MKMLIVNDDKTLLVVMESLINSAKKQVRMNLEVLKATNGKHALELFQNHSHIQCILMDINMPVMDGYDSTKQIRQFEQ